MPPVDLEALARIIDSGTHPANPAVGGREAENPVLEKENPCRVGDPAPTLHHPSPSPLQGACRVVQGEAPCNDLADGNGHKPPLERGVQGLQGGFSEGGVQVVPTLSPVERVGGRSTLAQTWQARLNTAREIRARWFNTPPRPLPPEVLKRVGAVPEIHGLQGCWNMAGNRLPAEELKALLDLFASQGEKIDAEVEP